MLTLSKSRKLNNGNVFLWTSWYSREIFLFRWVPTYKFKNKTLLTKTNQTSHDWSKIKQELLTVTSHKACSQKSCKHTQTHCKDADTTARKLMAKQAKQIQRQIVVLLFCEVLFVNLVVVSWCAPYHVKFSPSYFPHNNNWNNKTMFVKVGGQFLPLPFRLRKKNCFLRQT